MVTKTVQKQKTEVKVTQAVDNRPRYEVVHDEIKKADQSLNTNHILLAKLLYEAFHGDFAEKWGYENFEEFSDSELDSGARKAKYLVKIWTTVKELKLKPARIEKIGWSKLREIVGVMDETNAEELLKKAESMSARELVAELKVTRRAKGVNRGPSVTTMTFRLEDSDVSIVNDALEEAKKLADSKDASIALVLVCQEWFEEKGAAPARSSLEDHIAHLERVYGVKITFKTQIDKAASKKKEDEKKEEVIEKAGKKADAKKSGKKEEKAPAKKGGKAAKVEEDDDDDDLSFLDDGEDADILDDDNSDDSGDDLDDVLGLDD